MGHLSTKLFRFKGHAQHLLKSNSPAILTALGVSGAITTAYLVGTASFKACRIIDADEQKAGRDGRGLPADPKTRLKERTQLVWKLYVPSAVSGTATVVCIVAASKASSRQTAAIATALSLSETAMSEYKDKVVETFGERKEKAIRDELAQDRVSGNPPNAGQLILAVPGNVLCFEPVTGRYFHSDMEALRKAENSINMKIIRDLYVPLNEFYYLLGLDPTAHGDQFGWTSEKGLLELYFSTVLSKENIPCISIEYNYTKEI